MIFEAENGTNGCYLAAFSIDVGYSHHFVAPYIPMEVVVVLAMPVKSYLK